MRATRPRLTPPERYLSRRLAWFRWAVIGIIFIITLLWPFPGRTAAPIWLVVLLFAIYNLAVELARRWKPWFRPYGRIALLDLPFTTIAYFFDGEPGGPLFVIFFVGVVSAGLTMSARSALFYSATTILVITVVAPTLPGWSTDPGDLRTLGSRLVVLALVGFGTAMLTRQLRLEQQLADAVRLETVRLNELTRLRSEFVHNVSHDLQTPLTAARAGLGLLGEQVADRLQPIELDLLNTVRRNIERLDQLIDDLLVFNQLEWGTLRLDRDIIDLRSIVAGAIATVHLLLREKGQVLEVDIPSPLLVEGDAHRLEQVLVNILTNAHRHTPRGTRIAVAGRALEHEVEIAIHDTGPGIAPEDLVQIFRRFYHSSSIGGSSGLGLAIAKAIVELHDGRIWAESHPGEGATFLIRLPSVAGAMHDATATGG